MAAEIPPGPCSVCAKPGVTTTCLRCGESGFVVRYCSRACQVGDWKAHKKFCGKEKAPSMPSPAAPAVAVAPNKPNPAKKPLSKKPRLTPINARKDEIKAGSP